MIPLVDPAVADDAQRQFLERAAPINLFRHLAHAPGLGGRVAALGAAVMNPDSPLDPALRELAALRTAVRLQGGYVEAQHRRVAALLGIPAADVAFACCETKHASSSALAEAMAAVDRLARAEPLEPERAQALAARLGPAGLVALHVTVGYFAMIAIVTSGLRTPVD